MAQYNELTASKSSGVSLYRTIFPLLLVSILISIGNFYLSESVVPQANTRRIDLWKEYVQRRSVRFELVKKNISLFNVDGSKIFIESFDARTNTAKNITVQKYSGQTMLSRIDSKDCDR